MTWSCRSCCIGCGSISRNELQKLLTCYGIYSFNTSLQTLLRFFTYIHAYIHTLLHARYELLHPPTHPILPSGTTDLSGVNIPPTKRKNTKLARGNWRLPWPCRPCGSSAIEPFRSRIGRRVEHGPLLCENYVHNCCRGKHSTNHKILILTIAGTIILTNTTTNPPF